jgi:hypothetical protein
MEEFDQQIAAARPITEQRLDFGARLWLDLTAARLVATATASRSGMDAAVLGLVGYVRHFIYRTFLLFEIWGDAVAPPEKSRSKVHQILSEMRKSTTKCLGQDCR